MVDYKESLDKTNKSLDEIKLLLKQLVALQLSRSGLTQDEICKKLNLSKTTVNNLLKGINKTEK